MQKRNNRSADQDADSQRLDFVESLQIGKGQALNPPVSIRVDHYRLRLCDYDNLNAKAAIDGIVHCGLLSDDGPTEVTEVRHFQWKVKNAEDERTEITITEVE